MEKNIVASPDRPSPVALPTMILQDLLLIRARRLNGLSVENWKKSLPNIAEKIISAVLSNDVRIIFF